MNPGLLRSAAEHATLTIAARSQTSPFEQSRSLEHGLAHPMSVHLSPAAHSRSVPHAGWETCQHSLGPLHA